MRLVLAAVLLLAATPVLADEAKKPGAGITYGDDEGGRVKGKVQKPGVEIVIPRDPKSKQVIDKSREQALREAAERIK